MKNFIFFIIVVVVGFYFGLLVNNIPLLTLDPLVNLVNLATLIFTISIAILLPLFLTKRIDTNKTKKQLIIFEIDTLSNRFKYMSDLFYKRIDHSLSIEDQRELKYYSYKARVQFDLVHQCTIAFKQPSLNFQLTKIKEHLFSYWDLATGDKLPRDSVLQISYFNKQEKQYEQLRKELVLLTIMINDC